MEESLLPKGESIQSLVIFFLLQKIGIKIILTFYHHYHTFIKNEGDLFNYVIGERLNVEISIVAKNNKKNWKFSGKLIYIKLSKDPQITLTLSQINVKDS